MPDERLTYEVLWYYGPEDADRLGVRTSKIKRYSLDGAILWACNRLREGKIENARLARGFYVRHIEVVV